MLNTIFSKGSLPALEAMMHFATARHKAIANNIANAEMVGYKAMDVSEKDFQKAMDRAFQEQERSRTGVFELEPYRTVRPGPGGLEARYEEAEDTGILRHIENNVDVEIEMGKLVKNTGLHNLAATLLSHQFGQLRSAITGRIGG